MCVSPWVLWLCLGWTPALAGLSLAKAADLVSFRHHKKWSPELYVSFSTPVKHVFISMRAGCESVLVPNCCSVLWFCSKTWDAVQVSLGGQVVREANGVYRHICQGAGGTPPCRGARRMYSESSWRSRGPCLERAECLLSWLPVPWKGKTELKWAKCLIKSQSSMGALSKLYFSDEITCFFPSVLEFSIENFRPCKAALSMH